MLQVISLVELGLNPSFSIFLYFSLQLGLLVLAVEIELHFLNIFGWELLIDFQISFLEVLTFV
jgi:hypothetical protein